ncbi:MAG: gas vesicle protein [Micromonosporaceae bacterium]
MSTPPATLTRRQPDSLADVLERVLDKGVVIAGDVVVNVLDIELLSLKLRLFIASADTARQMGMDWWTTDPFFSSHAAVDSDEHRNPRRQVGASGDSELEQENRELRQQLTALRRDRELDDRERALADRERALDDGSRTQPSGTPRAAATKRGDGR